MIRNIEHLEAINEFHPFRDREVLDQARIQVLNSGQPELVPLFIAETAVRRTLKSGWIDPLNLVLPRVGIPHNEITFVRGLGRCFFGCISFPGEIHGPQAKRQIENRSHSAAGSSTRCRH